MLYTVSTKKWAP